MGNRKMLWVHENSI